jgi:hypothetical protein
VSVNEIVHLVSAPFDDIAKMLEVKKKVLAAHGTLCALLELILSVTKIEVSIKVLWSGMPYGKHAGT